jgi:hypothetical protein
MSNLSKKLILFTFIAFLSSCFSENKYDDQVNSLTTEVRTSGCVCSGSTMIPPVIFDVRNNCGVGQYGSCCFSLRFSSAYQPGTNVAILTDGGHQIFPMIDQNGVISICIPCTVQCFTVTVTIMGVDYCAVLTSPCI